MVRLGRPTAMNRASKTRNETRPMSMTLRQPRASHSAPDRKAAIATTTP